MVIHKIITHIFLMVFIMSSLCEADEIKTWTMDEIVALGLEQSFSLKTSRENREKTRLNINSDTIWGAALFEIDNGLARNWEKYSEPLHTNSNITDNRDLKVGLSLPVYDLLSIDMGYSLDHFVYKESQLYPVDSPKKWNVSKFLQTSIYPLAGLKTISKYRQHQREYNLEFYNYLLTLAQTDMEIRQKYMNLISAINNKDIFERLLLNNRKLYELMWEKYKIGLVAQNDVDDALLNQKSAEDQFMLSDKLEYQSRIQLSRICNQDMSHAHFAPLPIFDGIEIDKNDIWANLQENSILLKIAKQNLETSADLLEKSRNAFLPDLKLSAGSQYFDEQDKDHSYYFEASLNWKFGYSKFADSQKACIEFGQNKRNLKYVQDQLEENFNILIYDYQISKNNLQTLNKLLENQRRILELKQIEYNVGKLHSIQLEKYKIDVTQSENRLKDAGNELWLLWYRLQMAKEGLLQ